MKKVKAFVKASSRPKKIVMALVVVALLASCVGGTYAAYISRSYVKGVAATPSQSLNMSSDLLNVVSQSLREEDYPVRRIVLDKKSESDNTPYVVSFYIENTSKGSVSTKRIDYLIRIKGITDEGGNLYEGVSVFYKGVQLTGTALTQILTTGYQTDSMPANSKTTHNFQIKIDKDKLETVKEIRVVAVPTAESDSSGNMLAANIQPSTVGTVATFSYQGIFIDKTSSNCPYDFAAFNYEVSVAGATDKHTMLLTWDNAKLEIDPKHGSNTGSLEIEMGGESNDEIIKFYRLVGRNQQDDWQSTWTKMEEIVSFTEKTTG